MSYATRCKSCGEPIWMANLDGGCWHQFNREADDEERPDVSRMTLAQVVEEGELISHFDTCPDAEKHRRRR